MINLFDFLHDLLPTCDWYQSAHETFDLSDTDIIDSVQKASEFFNINAPMSIHEDWTTGVLTGLPFTEDDDILVFNRQQLTDLGITDRNSFDLVMTHEAAHRALQGCRDEYTFNCHQEELCCDFMAGVRAELNSMTIDKMVASLEGTFESATHPDGTFRVEAIGLGADFAHSYMEEHGKSPTLSDCIEHFEHSRLCNNQVNLSPDDGLKAYTQGDIEWLEHQVRITSGSEQAHWLDELKWAKSHISGYVIVENLDGRISQYAPGYTESDIRRMRDTVSNLESQCSKLKDQVHHWENMVSLDPKDGYSYDKLAEAKSKYNNAQSELKEAKSKLNNAL